MNATDDLIADLSKAGLTGKWGEAGNPKWIKIWVRDQWRCVYCGAELLKDVIAMYSAQIDHLLPASRYPELWDTETNFVLSCYCCNQIKRDFDPIKGHEELKDSPLETHRNALIGICRDHIASRLESKKHILERSRAIVDKFLSQG